LPKTLDDIETMAVIGAGKIGSAIIKAVLKCRHDLNIIATGRREETLKHIRSLGIEATRNNDYAVRSSELIVLSVKPYHFPVVVKQVSEEAWKEKTVISVMAGVKLETLEKSLKGAEVYRAMPNINALVMHSATALALNRNNYRNKEVVEDLFRCLGSIFWVPEDYLDIWTGLVGSAPAFIAEIIDGLILGAVASGMNRELAYSAILDVLEGTAKLLKTIPIHPAEMRDEVTTPAGTTIRGLMMLESEGVKAALMKTVETSYKRSAEIGNEIDKQIRDALKL